MKRLLSMFLVGLSFSIIGYVIGNLSNNYTPELSNCNTNQQSIVDRQNTTTNKDKSGYSVVSINHTTNHLKKDNDIKSLLNSNNDDDRINALLYAWRNNLIEQYVSTIERLANKDSNYHITTFAKWILNSLIVSNQIDSHTHHTLIADTNSPEEQLRESLVENMLEYSQQDNRLPDTDETESHLTTLYQLSQDEQAIYLNNLSLSQEDSAITALCSVITHHDISLKNAAIEELLVLLEDHTGHYEMIVEELTNNQSQLSDDQLQRLRSITSGNNQIATDSDPKNTAEFDALY